jgi:hypothetical protein
VTVHGVSAGEVTIHELTHGSALAANSFEHPDNVRATTRTEPWAGSITVPAHSVTLVEFPAGN